MKINRYIARIMILGAITLVNNQAFATAEQETIQQILDSNKYKETDSSIEFMANEYVRVIQPIILLQADSFVTTFEKEINLMGEARAGTQISITIYSGNEVYKKYELEPVGATQTFNQLLSLQEKDNTIVLKYTHPDLPTLSTTIAAIDPGFDKLTEADLANSIVTKIYRQPEEHKLKIKNYIVSTPGDLPGNLVETPPPLPEHGE
ncbi:hypothetical protein [Candidatus Epulonipiscium viviparus]|uniref:hypothetical protein n=1 Tax=Candidatus Epulonipiscium viviparus TaxID=420336 RepID=UPI0027381551|nr:hypothetical protein [Candidatus Epulopiscium viviparus]